jgi:hypothetical protein
MFSMPSRITLRVGYHTTHWKSRHLFLYAHIREERQKENYQDWRDYSLVLRSSGKLKNVKSSEICTM